MLYFAYGTNLDCKQMKQRCPKARFVGVAVLRDHKLAFTRKSVNRDCGVADVVPKTGCRVWGVVHELSDDEVVRLDEAEGYRPGRDSNSYWRRECFVFLDNNDEQALTVATYFGDPQPDPPLPNAEYKNLLLSGARYWHLPSDYVCELESSK